MLQVAVTIHRYDSYCTGQATGLIMPVFSAGKFAASSHSYSEINISVSEGQHDMDPCCFLKSLHISWWCTQRGPTYMWAPSHIILLIQCTWLQSQITLSIKWPFPGMHG